MPSDSMSCLFQEHIIHGDLKASNVLLKTCVPAMHSSSSCAVQQQQQPGQPGKSIEALGSVTGGWSVNGNSQAHGSSSRSSQTGSGWPPPGPPAAAAAAPAGAPAAAAPAAAAAAAVPAAESQGPAASMAIIDAASDSAASGMHSLLKCGWVVAKVSDFGLSVCVKPEETHVSSVHAVSGFWRGGGQ
jgi:hypothetical protein